MLRALCVFALAGIGIALFATGGQIGPLDFTNVPVPLIAFAGVSAVVLLALRFI
jgi:hypothetical protein